MKNKARIGFQPKSFQVFLGLKVPGETVDYYLLLERGLVDLGRVKKLKIGNNESIVNVEA